MAIRGAVQALVQASTDRSVDLYVSWETHQLITLTYPSFWNPVIDFSLTFGRYQFNSIYVQYKTHPAKFGD
jgi:hypothetical protein